MTLEFVPECGTAQAEDSLQLYIPAMNTDQLNDNEESSEDCLPYWPVLHRFSNNPSQWPQSAVVLPGKPSDTHLSIYHNSIIQLKLCTSGFEVVFSLETASDYVKDDKACFYGFKCLVTGYEWKPNLGEGLKQLETELAFLGGMCSASLMKKDLILPASSGN